METLALGLNDGQRSASTNDCIYYFAQPEALAIVVGDLFADHRYLVQPTLNSMEAPLGGGRYKGCTFK